MDKKLYLKIVFYIAGSIIVITVFSIAIFNFARDGRLFDKRIMTYETSATTGATTTAEAPAKTKMPTTLDFTSKREQAVTTEQVKKGEEQYLNPVTRIKVEVINYSNVKAVAEQIKTTLESNGFEVSIGIAKNEQQVNTTIIERNDSKSGADVQKIIKTGVIQKEVDTNSKFDVTVLIGDDYNP